MSQKPRLSRPKADQEGPAENLCPSIFLRFFCIHRPVFQDRKQSDRYQALLFFLLLANEGLLQNDHDLRPSQHRRTFE